MKATLTILLALLAMVSAYYYPYPDYPDNITLTATFRDFCFSHPDFQSYCCGLEPECFGGVNWFGTPIKKLGSLRYPHMTSTCSMVTSEHSFRSWWTNSSPHLKHVVTRPITLVHSGYGIYKFKAHDFFPLDDLDHHCSFGYGCGKHYEKHNFAFTMYLKTTFKYKHGQSLWITADDDCFVYIDGRLVINLAGVHAAADGHVDLDDIPGLIPGHKYKIEIFFAERHTCDSVLKIKTNIKFHEKDEEPEPGELDCETDTDGDHVVDCIDNCPNVPNPGQEDCDGDGVGDACDEEPGEAEVNGIQMEYYNFDNTSDNQSAELLSLLYPVKFKFEDKTPDTAISSQEIRVNFYIENLSYHACRIFLKFKSDKGSSPILSVIAAPGKAAYTRIFTGILDWFDDVNYLKIYTEHACNCLLGYVSIYHEYFDTQPGEACVPDEPCSHGTYRFGGYCACWSGAYGRFCQMPAGEPEVIAADGTLNCWNDVDNLQKYIDNGLTPLDQLLMSEKNFSYGYSDHLTCPEDGWLEYEPLITKGPPVLEEAFFSQSRLNMKVYLPMVRGRAEIVSWLNSKDIDLAVQPYCAYPTSDFIFKIIRGCYDIIKFDIPWGLAKQCDWAISQEALYEVYKGQIIVQMQEWNNEHILEWRKIQSVLRIQIRFRKFVSVEVDIEAFNAPDYWSFISWQVVAVQLGEPAVIELTTSIEWPYMLTNPYYISLPGFILDFELVTVNCIPEEFEKCKQRWQTTLYLTEQACELDGTYHIGFERACVPGLPECPLMDMDVDTDVVMVLDSEDFCATIFIDVGLIGEIASYKDPDFTIPRSTFIEGRRAYFLITVDSTLNLANPGSILFADTHIHNLHVSTDDDTWQLVSNGQIVMQFPPGGDPNAMLEIYEDLALPNQVGFSIKLSEELLVGLEESSSEVLTIAVEVEVEYSDGSKKRIPYVRTVNDLQTINKGFDTIIGIYTEDDPEPPTSQNNNGDGISETNHKQDTSSAIQLALSMIFALIALCM